MKLFGYKNLFKSLVILEKNKKLPLRILITGQEGIGKSSFALHLINFILSKNETDHYNLEKNTINLYNKSFNLVKNLTHPNFYLISKSEEKKTIEIDQIRNMVNFLNKSTFDNNKKIILIDSVENLNDSSSNALLKSLEDSNDQNLFILTHNSNKKIFDTISSRCLPYRLNFDYKLTNKVLSYHFDRDIFNELNHDFKNVILSPKFLINHVNYVEHNKLNLKSLDAKSMIYHIIENKSYKKNSFVANNFQSYIEIFLSKMYSNTKDFKYYNSLLEIVSENNLVIKFNLDLDSFFLKFENKYLNI